MGIIFKNRKVGIKMRSIDFNQMAWLIILSVSSSFTALVVDESVLALNQFKLKGRETYWFWVLMSMFFAWLAQCVIRYGRAQAAGSGIP